jgi:glutamate dehydrogenase/leucine dehydrogenase
MEAALAHLGQGTLEGKTVATQGLGNVAGFMIRDLLQRKVARIIGADVDERCLATLRGRFSDARLELRVCNLDDTSILAETCDVLAPNALGASLNSDTIPHMKAKVICGAANNQLADHHRDAPALKQRGVLYVPDFLANRMGIVNCANEAYGVIDDDPAVYAHFDREAPHGIYQRCLDVFKRAKQADSTPADEAIALADELSMQAHPIWGNRGQLIVDALVKSDWAQSKPIA